MRQRYIGGAVLAVLAMLTGPDLARAQDPTFNSPAPGGDGGGFQPPLNADPIIPLPTGKTGDAGFYVTTEFVMLNMQRTIGSQVIAQRGFYDSSGNITGTPGTFIGGGATALDTKNFSGSDWQPGYRVELGYRTQGGIEFFVNYMNLMEAQWTRGAGPIPPGLSPDANLADTFLSSPAYNFSHFFAGPQYKLGVDGTSIAPAGYTAYGIWNGATEEDMKYIQRFTQAQAASRIPLFQTEYTRTYAMAGGQFDWIFERFQWYTADTDIGGNQQPNWSANYQNTLSQRMYGAMAGLGYEIFVANQFSISIEGSGAGLMDVCVERAKYELADQTTEAKWGIDQYRFVPNLNAAVNLWWYPVEGVQVRFGYEAMSFFNTLYMKDPVGFDVGDIDPKYGVKAIRIISGFNFGIGFFF